MNSCIALFVGLMAGAHSSTWGMYKDAPFEGFTWKKYFRSIIISGSLAVILQSILNIRVTQPSNMVILFGLVYSIERFFLEFYKTFLREEDQSKYFIPMQFHIFGKIVQKRCIRWFVGLAYACGIVLVTIGIYFLQKMNLNLPGWVQILLIGSIGGWISCFGGAWKDAPIEGFQIWKFFRSPFIALAYAVIIACFTENYIYIVLSAIGYTVGTIETYKTFFFPSKPRGKFTNKPIQHPEWINRRKWFIPLYITIWIAVVITFIIALTQARSGLI